MAAAKAGAARYETLRETVLPIIFCTRSARSSSYSRSTMRRSARSARACSAASRLTSSLLVTETRAMLDSRLAARSVSSRWISPMTTGTPRRRANATPGPLGSRSMATTGTPRSCSWATTSVPTLPSPTTITWPLVAGGRARIEPVSRAPTTSAVTNGTNTRPSKVSRICATFSAPPAAGLVSAAPAASSMVRYSAVVQG
jgi:hypothetical protein